MSLRVLVVDDSRFFRDRLIAILRQDRMIDVVGTASNGLEAVAQCASLKPDLVTMDVEMPVMDGIGATRRIMSQRPLPIVMVSSLTRRGADVTLRALEAGALDYVPKSQLNEMAGTSAAAREFCQRLRALAVKPVQQRRQEAAEPPPPARPRSALQPIDWRRHRLLLLGASTGGPMAVMELVRSLAPDLAVPVVIVQHMPASFTEAYAQRLNELSSFEVAEARDGECLRAGQIRVAPGGRQLLLERSHEAVARLRITAGAPGELYRPSVDLTFDSAADAVGGRVLAIMLTGMGRDGAAGSGRLKSRGAEIWAQDERSCVVYGMPKAVVDAGLADRVLPLDAMSRLLGAGGS